MEGNEAFARTRIDNMIEFAGFSIREYHQSKPFVGLEGHVLDPVMRERLQKSGKRPDYHFYPPESSRPIAFLEAKKFGGLNLALALDQATDYARKACENDKPEMLVFASDGYQVRSRHANGTNLTCNNSPVDFIPSWELMKSLVSSPSIQSGKTINSVKKLIEIFNSAANAMRTDGIDAGIDQLREFCILLFFKIMNERRNNCASHYWDSITRTFGQQLLDQYQDLLQECKKDYGDIFAVSQIANPVTLEEMVSKIKDIDFSGTEIDVKGQAFEYFLSTYSAGNKSVLGQYFTPRHITSMMVTLLSPKLGDKIIDPFCGTGGMLISCYTQVRMELDKNEDAFEIKVNQLKLDSLYGTDISGGASALAKMNMILLGDGQSNIQRKNSFNNLEKRKYHKLITNIPFNLKVQKDIRKLTEFIQSSDLKNPDWNELCVIKCLESVRGGGGSNNLTVDFMPCRKIS